jgi:hypothetical protein
MGRVFVDGGEYALISENLGLNEKSVHYGKGRSITSGLKMPDVMSIEASMQHTSG